MCRARSAAGSRSRKARGSHWLTRTGAAFGSSARIVSIVVCSGLVICVRLEINRCAPYSAGNIFRSNRQRAIQSCGHLLVVAQSFISKRDLLEYGKIARIQLQCLLHFLQRFLPLPLAAIDIAGKRGIRDSLGNVLRASNYSALARS